MITEDVKMNGHEWNKWDDMQGSNPEGAAYKYRGADPTFVTLSGETAEQEWILDTLYRRWLDGECICGCGLPAYDEGEDEPDWGDRDSGRRFLQPDCHKRFMDRLQRAGAADDCIERNSWSGEYWDTWLRLQEVYRALWSAEIRRSLQNQLRTLESDVEAVDGAALRVRAEQERVRQALGENVSRRLPTVLS